MLTISTQPDNISQHMSACNICGQDHETNKCSFLQELHYVSDTPVISRARQTLPKALELINMADGSITVITKVEFPKGTTFGPLCAKRISMMNPLTNFPIKVFGSSALETYHLDYSNEESSNWMCFISPASNTKEQNLICYQVNQDIFYTATRIISAHEELKVWYAPHYATKMGVPVYDINFPNIDVTFPKLGCEKLIKAKHNARLINKDIAHELAEKLPAKYLGAANNRGTWSCKLCSIEIQSVISYAKHLMEHYKPLLSVFCDVCNKKCNNMTVLRKHKKLCHLQHLSNNNSEEKMTTNNQNNTQNMFLNLSNSDTPTSDVLKDLIEKVGKPSEDSDFRSCSNEKGMNSDIPLLDSSSINVNDLLQNNGCLNINLELTSVSDSVLSENCVESVKFNVMELPPDILDIVSEGGNDNKKTNNLDCDICNKKFDKLHYLYRHLRKHTGEFLCPSCLNVFARKENLLSHACFKQKLGEFYECSICQKSFVLKKYLKKHLEKHNDANYCKYCKSAFSTQAEYDTHECALWKHICVHCKKKFTCRAHLTRHVKLHVNSKSRDIVVQKQKKRKPENKPVICEKCGSIFKNQNSLKQHLRSHGERLFECDVCHSRFHRIGVLKEHKTSHESAQVPCNVCGKKMRSKKALDIHVLVHGNKKYHCEKCGKSFFQKCNYLKHYKQVHTEKERQDCPYCSMKFTNKSCLNKHVACHIKSPQFTCTVCTKEFHKEFQLKRHMQGSHSGITYRCPFCQMNARHKHSMRRHFERQHKDFRDKWDLPGFVNELAQKSETFVAEKKTSEQETCNVARKCSEATTNPPAVCTEETSFTGIQLNKDQSVQKPQSESGTVANIQNTCSIIDVSDQQVLLQPVGGDESEITNGDLNLSEISRLSTNDSNGQLTESVLRNAYIFDEGNGDIMFYVLDNTTVTAEY